VDILVASLLVGEPGEDEDEADHQDDHHDHRRVDIPPGSEDRYVAGIRVLVSGRGHRVDVTCEARNALAGIEAARLDNIPPVSSTIPEGKSRMVTGFNTDVKYKGVTYHVQTEDKGPTTPMVLTLIYKGGEILGAKRFHYKDVPEAQDDKGLAKLMEDIHAATMNEVKQGRYAPQDDKTVIEDLSLDQLVLAYLASRAAASPAR
jgi:hypothetical protein